MAIYAGTNGFLDKVPVSRVAEWEQAFDQYMDTSRPRSVRRSCATSVWTRPMSMDSA